MQTSAEKRSHLDEGRVFDPKAEIQKIASGGNDGYSYERVLDFRQKFAFQTAELAKLEEDVVRAVEENPKIPEEDVLAMAVKRAKELGLSEEQSLLSYALLHQFMRRHKAVLDVVERNGGSSKAIYSEVFGKEPEGEVEFIVGPSVLHFRCHNLDDYAYIRQSVFQRSDQVITEKDRSLADLSGGTLVLKTLVPELDGGVTAEKALGRPFDEYSRGVYEHEKTHALVHLFLYRGEVRQAFQEMKQAIGSENIEYKMLQYMRALRGSDGVHAGDEIIAYFAMGEKSSNILSYLTMSQEEGGLYDYFHDYVKDPNYLEQFLVNYLGEDFRSNISSGIKRVFVDEYRKELKQGVEAVQRMQSRGFSIAQIASILGRTPLERWPHISMRFAAEIPLPYNEFRLMGASGTKVVVANDKGELFGGVELEKYDGSTGNPVCKYAEGEVEGTIVTSAFEDFKALNYPYKPASLWLEVWKRSGGDPTIESKLGLDLSSTDLMSADEVWAHFRPFCKPDSRPKKVFDTYRRLQREVY